MNLRPDPTFYPTPKMAMDAPVEKLAFTLMLSPDGSKPDGLAVVDVDPTSKTYGTIGIACSCQILAMSFTTLDGTHALLRYRR